MAHRIVARITNFGGGYEGMPDNNMQIIVKYHVTGGGLLGEIDGEALLEVDVTTSDAVTKSALGDALCDYVNPLISPPQNFTNTQVRGLSL